MKLTALFVLLLSFSAYAQMQQVQEPLVFENQQQQDRFDQLTKELRCLVCQNQNLADSDAPLAHDLRREVHAMLQTGQSDEQIKQFMVERYGDFVLYRPPVQTNTYLLWLAPLVLLLGGALVLRSNIKKRTALLGDDQVNDKNNQETS
jgi:cytochrome c-type biogenesis protein CcmH